jgi:hypothetical protein
MILSCGHENRAMTSKYLSFWESEYVRGDVNNRKKREREDCMRGVVRASHVTFYSKMHYALLCIKSEFGKLIRGKYGTYMTAVRTLFGTA